jgi:succinate-acetate transporter protein
VQRRALGLLFTILTLAFAVIAVASAREGQWVIALAAVALGAWLGSLALKGLRLR